MWGGWPEWTTRHEPPCKPKGMAISTKNMDETIILIPLAIEELVGQKDQEMGFGTQWCVPKKWSLTVGM